MATKQDLQEALKAARARRCTEIADMVVPEYRSGVRAYSCTGLYAKRWQAAWDGACVTLGSDPKEHLK